MSAVTAQVRPRVRWFMDGWEWEVATYGHTTWGNGISGWCRSREKAEAKARLWKGRIEQQVAERVAKAQGWKQL